MSLIIIDALNLSYYLVKTTVTGAISGGTWIYEKITDSTIPSTDTPNNYLAITNGPTNNSSQPIIELSDAERRLLNAFLELPSWKKEQYMCEAMVQNNNQILSQFSFGERGPLVTIRFLDLRTNLTLAYICMRLDPELTIEKLRNELKKQAPSVKPNIHEKDWFILKAEQPSSIPLYNQQLTNQQFFHKVHIKTTDSVSILQTIKTLEIDEPNYGMPANSEIFDVYVDV
jgi:hypothetical protein